MSPKLQLISFDICPYVERSRIVLEHKGLPYDIRFIDLSDKPEWFLRISPRGKVPVLEVDGEAIFESAVINEFLEDRFPDPPMLPADPLARARDRAWIVYVNDVLMPDSYTLWIDGPEGPVDAVRAAWARLDAELAARGTPYFGGGSPNLIDVVLRPLFTRMEAAALVGCPDVLTDAPHMQALSAALNELPAFQRAVTDDLTERTVAYVEGVRQP